VQGSWSIEVRDPDGSLVERRDFDNELIGNELLAELLAGDLTAGPLAIQVLGDPQPCNDDANQESTCFIYEPIRSVNNSHEFNTLNVSIPDSGDNEDDIVLGGNFTAGNTSDIDQIRTRLATCEVGTAPDQCNPQVIGGLELTSKLFLDNPISVQQGQQVNVTVVISFN
jgi:hypothetical protein